MSGTLYIVATPIGNLEDITFRALKILKDVDVILAEDTRVSLKLLKHYEIVRPTLSYHQKSGTARKEEILHLLMSGKNLALVTDAGTPGVSDPGNELIAFLSENLPDLEIVPVPGASALTSVLSVSGFNVNKFVFLGFLPKKKRSKLFSWLKAGKISFVFYESPNRILKSLKILSHEFGFDTKVVVARELTKVYETIYRGTLKSVYEEIAAHKVRGEVTVVVELF